MIAALYVATGGCYFGLDGVDPWDEARDARLYAGPWPVVAHPPCERWGRSADGGNAARVRRIPGDDGGCFESALASVRKFGGVLEHPEGSAAWPAFKLLPPPRSGGWVTAGDFRGWTCCVEQGHYGHAARKMTWLYVVGVALPDLQWGRSIGQPRPIIHRPGRRDSRTGMLQRLSHKQRKATPLPFRDLLLSIARSARPVAVEVAA